MTRLSKLAGLLCAAMLSAAAPSQAQNLTVGLSADVTSVDPHFYAVTSNQQVFEHIFDRLVLRGDKMQFVPGLALSWKPVSETVWEFKLRPNVKFHDGTPFTAEDVAFSIERVPTIKDSPGSFTTYTRAVKSIDIVDPLTIRFTTEAPYPTLPNDLSQIGIVSKKIAATATTADFNSGKAAIGTGPYKLVRYQRGDRVELVRNEDFWGKKPAWEKVTLRIITNDSARTAALLANDVQLIDNVPVADIQKLRTNDQVSLVFRPTIRFMYLALDQRDVSPFVTDKAGKPLEKNPFKDIRVRQAVSLAIDRDGIRQRVMEGASSISGNLVLPGMPGYSQKLDNVERVDLDRAKKLLAEAGFPEGFNVTLHAPNNRYVQDEQIAQAVAAMLTRIGITTRVEALPFATYSPRATKLEFSFMLWGWGADSGEASSPLRAIFSTRNPAKGLGASNRFSYSNPKVDEALERAQMILDVSKRDQALQGVVEMVARDYGYIPLHFQTGVWATRPNVRYPGRADERTFAFEATPR